MRTILIIIFFLVLYEVHSQERSSKVNTIESVKETINQTLKSDACYIENKGQWDKTVKYLIRSKGLDIWITETGIVYDQYKIEDKLTQEKENRRLFHAEEQLIRKGHIVRVEFGKRISEEAVGDYKGYDIRNEYHNYFIGNKSEKSVHNVPLYSSVIAKNIYKGIDIHYYTDKNIPRYDIIVNPTGNPNNVSMDVKGSNSVTVVDGGNLQIHTSIGVIEQNQLFAYQEKEGKRNKIECSFVVGKKGKISFDVGNYDKSRKLIIDPLVFSTYLGGSADEAVNGVAIDANGDIYVAGRTSSTNFPTIAGAYQTSYGTNTDAFVTKMNSTGTSVIYSTYIGGSNNEQANDIAVDASGNAYITGFTKSTDFDITSGVFQTSHAGGDDVYVTKINASGSSLLYSTFIGGSSNDIALGIKVDGSGNAYVCGRTQSSNYDITSGAYQTTLAGGNDIFVTKVNSNGTALLYSTFIGGSSDEEASAIAIDGSGNAYITGYTMSSTNFDITSGVFQTTFGGAFFFGDAFVTKINSSGNGLTFSTYIGGSDDDFATDITIDASNNVYIAGYTYSTNYDVQSAIQGTLSGQTDLIISKLNSTGTSLVYSTYLGGTGDESATELEITISNEVIITGNTSSTDYDVVAGSYQTTSGGGFSDAFCTKLNAAGNGLVYSSYIGGSDYDSGNALVLDGGGNAIIAGITSSTNYDITSGVYQTSLSGTSDGFISKFGIGSSITVTAPNTAITLCAGNSFSITWTHQNITNVKIELSSNGGSTFPVTIIASTSAAAGSYTWNIPANQTSGTQYRVRISDASNSSTFDISNVNFIISTKAVFAINHDYTVLFPPNQTLRTIISNISINGGCSPSWVLKSITSNEADNGVVPNDQSNDIQNASLNTADNSFSLRAERNPAGSGRMYSITYTLTDGGSSRDTIFRIAVPTNLGISRDIQSGTCITLGQSTPNIYTGGNANFTASLTGTAIIKVRIFNSKGKDIVWIGQGSFPTGTHSFVWNGKDRNNNDVPNGLYYTQISGDCGISSPLTFLVQRP